MAGPAIADSPPLAAGTSRICGSGPAAKARELSGEAATAEREAHDLAERALWLSNAVARQAQAEQADLLVSALEAEREQQATLIAEIGGRLGGLSTERQELDGRLTQARESGDLQAIASLRGRVGAIDDLAAVLSGRRAAAQARAEAIGDGDLRGRGELADARGAADGHNRAVGKILNDVWPDRAEAVQARARAEFRATLDANAARIEANRRKPEEPSRVVML